VKHTDTRAALDHADTLAEPDDRGEILALPEDFAPVHAFLRPPVRAGSLKDEKWPPSKDVVFIERGDNLRRAACGKVLKVILPMPFDETDTDSCQRCRTQVARWADDVAGWWAARDRQEAERLRHQEEAEVAAVRQALQGRGEEPTRSP
jgi:hypothetical protein